VANEDKAARYHRLKRRASILGTAVSASLLVLIIVTGGSAAFRSAAEAYAADSFTLTVIVYVLMLALAGELIQLPLAFYQGVTLERRYGLSTESHGHWWLNHLKGTALALAFLIVGAVAVAWLLRAMPDGWWIAAALLFAVVLVALAQLAPIVLLPLFYDFTPLEKPELRDRLVKLADRAGARVLGVFEWKLGDRTRKANAALTGIGRTRRIIVSDTLLAEHSDDEIEVIMAHELSHHIHHDIWTGIALEAVLLVLGFYLSDRMLSTVVGRFGITGKADPAALPILLLSAGLVSLALMPLANALSRAQERRADRYALEMTKNVPAFVTAMKRLGATNLAEERPSVLTQILFYSHPPIDARIRAAETWRSAKR
jgi:STE24 endopeptidase